MMINASDLRIKENLKKIEKKPGYYKWWATKEDYDLILKKLNVNYDDIKDSIEIKDDLYCVYVGIAVNETIGSRLDWHVNNKHNKNNIKTGYISTLRRSISSVVSDTLLNQEKTDEFINRLKIEYFLSSNEVRSIEAKNEIEPIEKELMLTNLYVFNLKDNKHELAGSIRKQLQSLRNPQRVAALEYFEKQGDIKRDALISIKPKYVEKILSHDKLFEFRKKVFKEDVERVIIYSSSPIKKIVGYFYLNEIIEDTPINLWKKYQEWAGIEENAFFEYYEGRDVAYAIKIDNLQVFDNPIDVSLLEDFKAPQSYKYLDKEEFDYLLKLGYNK